MALQRSRMQTVALKKRKQVIRDDQSGYEDDHISIDATVQPLSGSLGAQMYGERLSVMKLMMTQTSTPIDVGMGVCVDVPADAHPDYKVVYVAPWSRHTNVHLEYIPAGERVSVDAD